jgi:hypothetical protein
MSVKIFVWYSKEDSVPARKLIDAFAISTSGCDFTNAHKLDRVDQAHYSCFPVDGPAGIASEAVNEIDGHGSDSLSKKSKNM